MSGSSKRKRGRPRKRGEISYKEENQEEEDDERPRRVKDGFRSLVPPPLKICVECGLKSSSHQENIDHWTKVKSFFNINKNKNKFIILFQWNHAFRLNISCLHFPSKLQKTIYYMNFSLFLKTIEIKRHLNSQKL